MCYNIVVRHRVRTRMIYVRDDVYHYYAETDRAGLLYVLGDCEK